MNPNRQTFFRAFIPILLIFIFVSASAIVFRSFFESRHVDTSVLLVGNIILFAVTAVSFIFYRRAVLSANTQVFLRFVYSGMMLKLFVCVIAAFIYISIAGSDVNRPALFILMFFYLLYTFSEVALLFRQSRQIKHRNNA